MKPWERWSFGLLTLVVSITGVAYCWMKYFMVTDDPFAVVNHPWQPGMLAIHIVASPWLLLVFGILMNSHIMRKLRVSGMPNRKTGYLSLGTFFTMAASGYLLQVVTGDRVLPVLVAVHVASGVIFSGAYFSHLVIGLRLSRSQAVRPQTQAA